MVADNAHAHGIATLRFFGIACAYDVNLASEGTSLARNGVMGGVRVDYNIQT